VFAESQMYTVRPYSWVESLRYVPWQTGQIAWVTAPVLPGRTLITLGMPAGNQAGGTESGTLAFQGKRPSGQVYDVAVPKLQPSALPGYCWTLDPIPTLANSLALSLPVWNADFADRTASVRVRLTSGNRILAETTSPPVQLPAAQTVNTQDRTGRFVPFAFLTSELRRIDWGDAQGILNLGIEAELLDEGGAIVDGWHLGGANLSLAPSLKSLGPCFGKTGDTVSLNGAGFGPAKPETAGVWFNGALASQYVLWRDDLIRVKVPPDATSGDVVLALRSEPAYQVKPKPFQVVQDLPYPRITSLSGTYRSSTWQFQHRAYWTGGTPPYTVKWLAGNVVLDERTQQGASSTVSFVAVEIGNGFRPGEGYFVRLSVQDSKGEMPRWITDVAETNFYVVWDLDTMQTSTTIPAGFPYPEPACPNP